MPVPPLLLLLLLLLSPLLRALLLLLSPLLRALLLRVLLLRVLLLLSPVLRVLELVSIYHPVAVGVKFVKTLLQYLHSQSIQPQYITVHELAQPDECLCSTVRSRG